MIMVILVHYEQCFHLCKWFRYFQEGCPIFFVASGFGIACMLARRFGGGVHDWSDIKKFYLSRLRALAPAWIFVLILVYTVNTVMLSVFGQTLSFGKNRSVSSVLCNLLFLHGLLPFCNNNVMLGGWYIGATIILYTLTPMIVASLRRCKHREVFFVLTSASAMMLRKILWIVFGDGFAMNGFSYYVFLVHYPSYLLGIILFSDFSESKLSSDQVKQCRPAGIALYAVAFTCFFSGKRLYSSWITALATYLVLYWMLSKDACHSENLTGRILIRIGRNSYCIFLIHGFFAYSFVKLVQSLCALRGIDARTIPFFIALMPAVVFLSCAGGVLLRWTIQRLTQFVHKRIEPT